MFNCSTCRSSSIRRRHRRAHRIRIQDGYNLILRKGWTRPTPQLLVLLRGLVRLYHGRVVSVLEKVLRENPTDLVLSVIRYLTARLPKASVTPRPNGVRHSC